jgi:hypothetical protein
MSLHLLPCSSTECTDPTMHLQLRGCLGASPVVAARLWESPTSSWNTELLCYGCTAYASLIWLWLCRASDVIYSIASAARIPPTFSSECVQIACYRLEVSRLYLAVRLTTATSRQGLPQPHPKQLAMLLRHTSQQVWAGRISAFRQFGSLIAADSSIDIARGAHSTAFQLHPSGSPAAVPVPQQQPPHLLIVLGVGVRGFGLCAGQRSVAGGGLTLGSGCLSVKPMIACRRHAQAAPPPPLQQSTQTLQLQACRT